MRAKSGDMAIYQVYETIDDGPHKCWNTEVSIIKESNLDYYNKTGPYENNKYYVINYIIPKEILEECKIEDIKKVNEKI